MSLSAKALTTALALGLAGLAGGCTSQSQWHDTATAKRNTVELVRMTHMVEYDAGASRLSAAQAAALDAFMAENGLRYGDEVWVDAGTGPLASARREAVISRFREMGITVSDADLAYGPAPARNEARVIVGRYVVTPPDCPDWRKPSDRDYLNTPSSNMGCATMTNLGLMVANPKDLLHGREHGSADTERVTDAVNKYRSGKVEDLEKTETKSE